VEKDLADALESGQIAAAGLDVLDVEPMSKDNPLVKVKDSTKLIITPHIAWAAVEARQRLMKIIEGQIEEFLV
jgi:glycerate dehydrogenase